MNFSHFSGTLPEFVGTTVLDSIGLVIPGVDPSLREQLSLPEEITTLGLLSSRIGAAGQIVAADEAIKNSNATLVSIELPRDTKGWGGHGCYVVLGGRDVSDLRRAVELALEEIKKNSPGVMITKAGHLELAYSARAGEAIHAAFGTPVGASFGFLAGSPAAIGMVMADNVVKTSPVRIDRFMTPDRGTAHSNEVILAFSGEASATKEAVARAKEVGTTLLCAMGDTNIIYGTEL